MAHQFFDLQPRRLGKSQFIRTMTEVALNAGKTVLACNNGGMFLRRRIRRGRRCFDVIEPVRNRSAFRSSGLD